jgi:hypothetical protein
MADATVALIHVDISRVTPLRRGTRQEYEYDGEVKLRACSRSLDVVFTHHFTQSEDIPQAIEQASVALERELSALTRACSNVLQAERESAQDEEDGMEGPEDDQ